MDNSPLPIDTFLTLALLEDAPRGDITSAFCVEEMDQATATLTTKADGVFFGEDVIRRIFDVMGVPVDLEMKGIDGGRVHAGDVLVKIQGSTRALLKAERVMLNLIQRLSGIATATRAFVDTLASPTIRISDTRKTTPLLRNLEKQAVVAGGGRKSPYLPLRYGASERKPFGGVFKAPVGRCVTGAFCSVSGTESGGFNRD